MTGSSILTSGDPDLALFTNISVSSSAYWSSTEFVLDTNQAWWFWFGGGQQNVHVKPTPKIAWAVRDGDVAAAPGPTVRLQLNATSTSFFDDFTIVFEDTGDGLLQQSEIISFSGVSGTSPTTGTPLVYSGIAYIPAIPGISTASGTLNPTLPCAQCWELTPGNFGDPSDGWFDTRWTYTVSAVPDMMIDFSGDMKVYWRI